MFAVRRRALTRSPRVLLARRTDTTLSDAAGGKTPHPNKSEDHPEETFGKGFYISIAAVVGCLALYKFEQSISGAKGSPISRAIEYYSDLTKEWEDRNSRHTAMVERAAADRSLFQDSTPNKTINLRSPEVFFNSGSPSNHEIGWKGNDLKALQAHYEALAREKK